MKYIVSLILILITQTGLALDKVQTKYGTIEIKSIGEIEKGVFYRNKVIFQQDGGYLDLEGVFHVGDSEIILVRNSDGGSGTIDTFFFVILTPDSKPIVLEEFMAQQNEIEPIQQGEKIMIDLGYHEGAHEVLTLHNKSQTISRDNSTWKSKPADEDDCNYLYNEIYKPYVLERDCQEAPEDIRGMATARAYYLISNDPHFDLWKFQSLSKESCQQANLIKYSQFKQSVCGGENR